MIRPETGRSRMTVQGPGGSARVWIAPLAWEPSVTSASTRLRRRLAIFDTFDDEAGRNAHLNGKVAAALMERAKAGDLFAQTPEVFKLEIIADKTP
jgi:hypothetical protein